MILNGDMVGVNAAGEKGILEVIPATETGMTTEKFAQAIKEWIATARHP